jgi:PadR family transcriptional regulator PadR
MAKAMTDDLVWHLTGEGDCRSQSRRCQRVTAGCSRKPDFGGAMISGLAEATAGGLVITEGSLYPALGRLEKKGFLNPEFRKEVEGRKPRKYYTLTEEGVLRLKELKAAWIPLVDGVTLLFGDENDE